jgi:hypothetical protein
MPPQDPDVVPWADPNADDPTVQDPSLDASYGADMGADKRHVAFHLGGNPNQESTLLQNARILQAQRRAGVAVTPSAQSTAWANYWADRNSTLTPYQRGDTGPQEYSEGDPNVNKWQDPNANDPGVQNPSLDSYVPDDGNND